MTNQQENSNYSERTSSIVGTPVYRVATTSLPAEVAPKDIVGMAAAAAVRVCRVHVMSRQRMVAIHATALRQGSGDELEFGNMIVDVERARLGVVDAQVDLTVHQ